MKKQLFISGCILLASASIAQQKMDLKPTSVLPPTGFNQVCLAAGYSNPNNGTTDLFGKNGKSDFSIPNNYMGSQEAVEGDNYFGIITYKGDKYIDLRSAGNGGIVDGKTNNYKYAEYIQVAMPSALVAGKEYEMSIKISLADYSAFATKGFGVYFSEKQMSETSNQMLTVNPQVSFSELITDKNTWTDLKAKFKATGNEKFAVIGCFQNNYSVENVGSGKSFGTVRSYYYLSAISLAEAPKPDRDKDGIIDELDVCPDVAGVEMFKGCPDSDGDGVADKDDACPTVKGLTNFAGCPDSDNDGVADNKDNCPSVAGTSKNGGCPETKTSSPSNDIDSDKDGIFDRIDQCPTVAGTIANSGCPEVAIDEKSKGVFENAMTGIQFETGKDVIKPSSYSILDNVVNVLKANTSWMVEVQGHTDNAGKYESNKTLSQKRAVAVKKYLVNKGVNEDMLKPTGYGSDRPIADNKTPAGKAKNRRVQFNVSSIK